MIGITQNNENEPVNKHWLIYSVAIQNLFARVCFIENRLNSESKNEATIGPYNPKKYPYSDGSGNTELVLCELLNRRYVNPVDTLLLKIFIYGIKS